jgi:hypothetical protein
MDSASADSRPRAASYLSKSSINQSRTIRGAGLQFASISASNGTFGRRNQATVRKAVFQLLLWCYTQPFDRRIHFPLSVDLPPILLCKPLLLLVCQMFMC